MKVLLFTLFLPFVLLAQIKNTRLGPFLNTDFNINLHLESKVTVPVEITQSFDGDFEVFITIEIYLEETLNDREPPYVESYIPKYLTTFSLFEDNRDFQENRLQKRLDNLVASKGMDLYNEDTLIKGFKSATIYDNFANPTGLANGFGPRIIL